MALQFGSKHGSIDPFKEYRKSDPIDLESRKISYTTTGDKQLIPAKRGFRVYIYDMIVVVDGLAEVALQNSGGKDLTGLMTFGAAGHGFSKTVTPKAFIWKTEMHEGLNFYISSLTALIGGSVSFWYGR